MKHRGRQAKGQLLFSQTQTKTRDINSKTIFHNPILCAQFLRDNLDIPMLKEIQPEDIEDVSERYQSYLGIEFEADTVKKIWLKGKQCEKGFSLSTSHPNCLL